MTQPRTLLDLVSDVRAGGVKIVTTYESGLATLTPPAGHLNSKEDKFPGLFQLPDGRDAVVIDSAGSQANRFEAGLKRLAEQIGYPLITVLARVSESGAQPRVLSTSLDWPHRHADAHHRLLRDELTAAGVDFDAVMRATPDTPDALLRHFPASLVYGWWHSQLAGKAAAVSLNGLDKQASTSVVERAKGYHRVSSPTLRSARVISSEVVARGITLKPRLAARVDPFGPLPGKGKTKDVVGFSALGLGALPPIPGPDDVVADEVVGTAFVSLSYLRRFNLDTEDLAVVLALALLGFVASDEDLHLRSGTDLAQTGRSVMVASGSSLDPWALPSQDELVTFLRDAGVRLDWSPVTVTAGPAYAAVHAAAQAHSAEAEE